MADGLDFICGVLVLAYITGKGCEECGKAFADEARNPLNMKSIEYKINQTPNYDITTKLCDNYTTN